MLCKPFTPQPLHIPYKELAMTEQVSQSKKRPTVLFQVWEPFRQSVIEENRFYLEQAKGKLLSQFNDIDREADAAGERWLEDQTPYFDPDRDDPGIGTPQGDTKRAPPPPSNSERISAHSVRPDLYTGPGLFECALACC